MLCYSYIGKFCFDRGDARTKTNLTRRSQGNTEFVFESVFHNATSHASARTEPRPTDQREQPGCRLEVYSATLLAALISLRYFSISVLYSSSPFLYASLDIRWFWYISSKCDLLRSACRRAFSRVFRPVFCRSPSDLRPVSVGSLS